MAFYSSTRRTEEVHASGIRVFKQVPQQQQHDHDSKPESWLVLHLATVRFVNQVGGTIGSTTTFDKKPFPFDLQTLSSPLSLKLFVSSIAQETGLFSATNCRLLAMEISDVLFTRFEFSKDAIYGTTTSLAILVEVRRAVLEELDVTNFEAPAPTGLVAHTAGRNEITYHTDEDQENDHADRIELTSSADDDEQEDHDVATSTTSLNKTSAGDEEQENHVHDASANEEEGRDDDEIYDASVGESEEEQDYDVSSSGEEEGDDEIESLDSFLDAFDEGFFDNDDDDDDDLIGDGPQGYEEVVVFELIVGGDLRNVIESNDQCSICLEGYSSRSIEVAKMHCGHLFHKHCITKWLARHLTCPFCRSALIALV